MMILASDIGEQVVRLNQMVRKLNKLSASSFEDNAKLYELFTEIMLEANKGREITNDRSTKVSSVHPFMDSILNLFISKK